MEFVVIQTFQTRIEAELFKNYLSSHGIDALVTADDLGGYEAISLKFLKYRGKGQSAKAGL